MKKLILSAFLLGLCGTAHAGFLSGGGPDFFRDANSEFYCASTAAFTTQAGVSLSTPAMSLYNPPGSGKNLVLLDVGIDLAASPAGAAAFSLAYNLLPSSGVVGGTQTITTSALIGKSTATATATSIAKCNLGGTLPGTPVAFRYIGGTTGASAVGGVLLADQTQGKVVVPPGGLISFQSSSAAQVLVHFLWREDPI